MFRDLMLLGKTLAEKDRCDDILEFLKDDMEEIYKYGLALKFQRSGEKVKFTGIERNELGSSNLPRVYYLKGSSPRSEDVSPVTKLTEKGPQKRVEDLRKCLQRMSDWSSQNNLKEFANLCSQIASILEDKKGEISAVLESKLLKEERKKRGGKIETEILPTFFYIEANDRPLCLYDECKDYLREMAPEKYGRIPKTEILCYLENGLCSVCQESSKALYGNYNEIKCYSLDKPGSIAGGANTTVASKNFPVCPDCAAFIKNGFKYAQQKLRQSIGGRPYLLLPKMEVDYLRRRWLYLFEDFQRDVLKRSELKDVAEKERYLLKKIVNEFHNEVLASYQMVFYKRGGGGSQEWKIIAEIEEVLPSRVVVILQTMENVENGTPFRHERRDRVDMYLVREFAGSHQRGDAFLEVLETIFGGQKKIPYDSALRWVVEHILNEYKRQVKEGRWTARSPVRGYLFLKFLLDLKVLERKEAMEMPKAEILETNYNRFMEAHRDFFDRPEKQVAFLTGCLIGDVLYVQKSGAFFKKLRGLRLDRERLQNLLPEAKNKLRHYESEELARDVLKELSYAWISTGNRWSINDDEGTFLFTLGLNLNYYIKQEMDKNEGR